jgi:glutathione peroxidase
LCCTLHENISIMSVITWLMSLLMFGGSPKGDDTADIPKTIYEFKVETLDGGTIDFSEFKGKKILIVNTASKCGYTPQYAELEKLYETYKDKLVIVGFPANNFLSQEPGDNKQISEFCQKNYGVSFPMASKISVKGKNMAPIYRWLTNKDYNHYESSSVKWNFQKYLLDEKGQLVAVFAPGVKPLSDEVVAAVKK